MSTEGAIVYKKLIDFFNEQGVKYYTFARAMAWIHVDKEVYEKTRKELIEKVKEGIFEPVVVYVPEAERKGVQQMAYGFKFAADKISEEIKAQPVAGGNAAR